MLIQYIAAKQCLAVFPFVLLVVFRRNTMLPTNEQKMEEHFTEKQTVSQRVRRKWISHYMDSRE